MNLGNLNVAISDRKIWNVTPNNAFKACVVSRTDYFPFGMEISSRTTNSDNYRFGYNGSDSYRKESDKETKGSGNSYTTEFRQYDPRLGRWLSLDPLMAQFPWQSPYCAFDNNPVFYTDPTGLATEDWIGKKSEDGKSINWEYNKDVTSADQLPEGYTEFAENGTIINTKDGYGRLGEGKFIPMSDTDYKASQGEFMNGHYYRIGDYGFEECGMMFSDAVPASLAAASVGLVYEINMTNYYEDQYHANVYRQAKAEAEYYAQVQRDYLMSTNILGISYQISPIPSLLESSAYFQNGNYMSATGILLLEFAPMDEVVTSGYKSFSAFKRANGSAGSGMAWHHLVEQNSSNIAKFGPEAIHNLDNLIKLQHGKGTIHQMVTNHYNSLMPGYSGRVRDYVKTLDYEQQLEYGLETLKRLGWKP